MYHVGLEREIQFVLKVSIKGVKPCVLGVGEQVREELPEVRFNLSKK